MKLLHRIVYLFSLFIISSLSFTNAAAESVLLPSEQEVNVEEYGSQDSKKNLLWLTSERGISGELQKTVLDISKQNDLHILMPDWHDSYFLEPSRSTLSKIPEQDYKDLIKHYENKFDKLNEKAIYSGQRESCGACINSNTPTPNRKNQQHRRNYSNSTLLANTNA